ncbi:MAG: 3'-5' exonuclease [Limnochordia bacterium]
MRSIKPTLEQKRFIEAVEDSILLHACVGTGKTFALANRVAEAIRRGVPPERILCVTFTNRAAEEMRQRVAAYCPQDSHKVVTRTFHGLCAWILRLGAKQMGIPQDFSIIDEDDAQEIIGHLKLPGLVSLSSSEIYHLLQEYKIYGEVRPGEERRPLSLDLIAKIHDLYQGELATYRGLDFADLIVLAHRGLSVDGPLHKEWSHRFDMVQVDEMQDTNLMEYEVVAQLARCSQNLTLAGDFDQTIYEWRGSVPEEVLGQFKRDFPQSKQMSFTENHRATQTLVYAAQGVVASLSDIKPRPAASSPRGEPIVVHGAPTEEAEGHWVASQIKALHEGGTAYDRMGVLCRSNRRAGVISEVLERWQIPHLTVETYEFFRRQEVKDSMAYLRILLNPEDNISIHRILRRPARGIGEKTIQRIEAEAPAGIRLSDLLKVSALESGDPYASLLTGLEYGTLVIFDCETTGVDPLKDEIIELAAYKIQKGELVEEFHRYLKPSKTVGDSLYVHGLTDEFLADNGDNPHQVLQSFLEFKADGLLVGHNVIFDIRMLDNSCHRFKIPFSRDTWVDTLGLARRFVEAKSYKLGDLAAKLGLSQKPSHRALDDVATTWELLQHLVPKIKKGLDNRQRIIQAVAHGFWPLAEQISCWRELANRLRPYQLLERVLKESGLLDYYRGDSKRLGNIEELLRTAEDFDDPRLAPLAALEAFVNFAALSRNIDRIDRENRVSVITVHQAKGLEFDVVFMSGLAHYEFPNYGAMKQGREREEARLFYVGITRAKRQLFLSYHLLTDKGRIREPSPYLRLLPRTILERSG